MATHKEVGTKDSPRTEIVIEPGEAVWICRCMKSKKYPFCDGTHREHEDMVRPRCPVLLRKKAKACTLHT